MPGPILHSRRGPDGGYWLARPAAEISLADVVRVTEGVEQATRRFPGAAAPLDAIWGTPARPRERPARRGRPRRRHVSARALPGCRESRARSYGRARRGRDHLGRDRLLTNGCYIDSIRACLPPAAHAAS
ncbi:Rrf2 family transcriptional regulator [Nonomuraea sp. NPDC049649]|uniref:Rrf2 family transcriptional regulator n=1 Tax=Nonomuraea sp. NPDC049649 TaxID=3155776 RepID=UPI003423F360